MNRILFIFLLRFFFIGLQAQKMVVQKPVINLWRAPVCNSNSLQQRSTSNKKILDSQLLAGERIIVTEKRADGWCKVQALDQPGREGGQWVYYYGWVAPEDCGEFVDIFPQYNLVISTLTATVYADKVDLTKEPIIKIPLGSQLKGKKVDDIWWEVEFDNGKQGYIQSLSVNEVQTELQIDDVLRNKICQTAKLFDHVTYCLGARCVSGDAGIDCSALVNIAYKVHGLRVPRNSRSQFVLSKKITPQVLKPADLIFVKYSRGKRKHIVHHVMMYLGDGMLIEATGFDPKKVRLISFQDKFGTSLDKAYDGMIVNGEQLFFSSFLSDESLCKQLRIGWFDPLTSIN